jgi:adenylate cyclase class 2
MVNKSDQEIEIKLYLANPETFQTKLTTLGAQLVSERIHEYNLVFDTPDKELYSKQCLLRLRQDQTVTLTYKGPNQIISGANTRQEFEIQVSDFEAACRLLQALGYHPQRVYEKYRTTYHYKEFHLFLDELPFGLFLEVEGPDATCLKSCVQEFGLDWATRLNENYITLFERAKSALQLPYSNPTFDNLTNLKITPDHLQVLPADSITP